MNSRQTVVNSIIDAIGKLGFSPVKTDIETRAKVAEHLCQLVNYAYPSQPPVRIDPALLAELGKQGYVCVPDFMDAAVVDRINTYFMGLPGHNAHVPAYGDGNDYAYNDQYPYAMLSYTPLQSLACPDLFAAATHPTLVSIAHEYLGCFPTLYSFNTYHTFPGKDYTTHSLHRDSDDFKFLACILYLSDVDDASGPFVYYPGSHLRESKEQPVTFTGKKGTLILADTFGFHHGSVPTASKRFACWWRYGLGLNGAYHTDKNYLFKIASPFGRGDDVAPEVRYLLRGFFEF